MIYIYILFSFFRYVQTHYVTLDGGCPSMVSHFNHLHLLLSVAATVVVVVHV